MIGFLTQKNILSHNKVKNILKMLRILACIRLPKTLNTHEAAPKFSIPENI